MFARYFVRIVSLISVGLMSYPAESLAAGAHQTLLEVKAFNTQERTGNLEE